MSLVLAPHPAVSSPERRASLLRRNPECRADVQVVAKQLVKDEENAKRQKS